MIKREFYLKKIRGFYHHELIKVITGVRRCGKSVFLQQIITELKQTKKIDSRHLIYLNFEDLTYAFIKNDIDLHQYLKTLITDKKKYYLFFDEIQNVNNFEKAVNSLRATKNVSIFITGSNAHLLSGELATHLSGRYISFRLLPFTFSEVCQLKKSPLEKKEEEFAQYLQWGGMPQIYTLSDESQYKTYLEDLYNSIILRDIIERTKIKDVNLLNRIVQFLMENLGGLFSANSIKKFLKSQQLNLASNTIYNYIYAIENSFIVNPVSRYDIRGKKTLSFYEKYYLADLGLLQLKKTSVEQNISGRLENIVYNEMLARGYKINIGKTDKGEIDFIVNNSDTLIYLQVVTHLASEEIIAREFGAYQDVNDNYPKYVLSLDKINYSQNGIIHRNLIDFLLDQSPLCQ
jgi:predicted AAA+ superfamily ATPase